MLRIEPSVEQIPEQLLGDLAILGRPLAKAEHVLRSVGIDAQDDQHRVIAEDDAIDHEHPKVQVAQRGREPGRHLPLRERDEAARHGALRGASFVRPCRERLQTPPVLPSRDSTGDRFHRVPIERIPIRSEGEARKRELGSLPASCSEATDRDPPSAECDVTRGASGPTRPAVGIVLALRSAEHFTILLHQSREDLLPDINTQVEERVMRVRENVEHRKRNLDGHRPGRLDNLESGELAGMLGHGGSFVVGYPVRTTRTVKEPPLSIPQFNRFWDIPAPLRVGCSVVPSAAATA